jgi:hypothetical protein
LSCPEHRLAAEVYTLGVSRMRSSSAEGTGPLILIFAPKIDRRSSARKIS